MCKFTHLPMFSVFNIKQITWKLGRAEYKVKARLLAIPTTSLFPTIDFVKCQYNIQE